MSKMTPDRLARLYWACFAIGVLPIVGMIVAEVVEAMALVWRHRPRGTPPTIELTLRYWLTAVFWYALWLLTGSVIFTASQRRRVARRPPWTERFRSLYPTRSEKVAAVAAMGGTAVLAALVMVGFAELLSLAWGHSLPLGSDLIRGSIFVATGFWTAVWLLVGASIQCRRSHRSRGAKRRVDSCSAQEMAVST